MGAPDYEEAGPKKAPGLMKPPPSIDIQVAGIETKLSYQTVS